MERPKIIVCTRASRNLIAILIRNTIISFKITRYNEHIWETRFKKPSPKFIFAKHVLEHNLNICLDVETSLVIINKIFIKIQYLKNFSFINKVKHNGFVIIWIYRQISNMMIFTFYLYLPMCISVSITLDCFLILYILRILFIITF